MGDFIVLLIGPQDKTRLTKFQFNSTLTSVSTLTITSQHSAGSNT